MPHGREVGLSPGDIVLDGDPATLPQKGAEPPTFVPYMLWPNEWMDHDGTDPDVTWRNGRGCLLVVHYLADLQSVHGFRCYDNITRTRNVIECLYLLYAWLRYIADARY